VENSKGRFKRWVVKGGRKGEVYGITALLTSVVWGHIGVHALDWEWSRWTSAISSTRRERMWEDVEVVIRVEETTAEKRAKNM